jgi:hypothetical protein
MQIPAKLLALAFVLGLLLLADASSFRDPVDRVEAAPQFLTVIATSSTQLEVRYRVEDDIGGAALLDSTVVLSGNAGLGYFQSAGDIPLEGTGTACSAGGINSNALTYGDGCVDGVDSDNNEDVQPPSPVYITAIWICNGTGNVTFTLTQLDGASQPSSSSVNAQCGGTGTGTSAGFVTVRADPTSLVCGGTTTLTAGTLEPLGTTSLRVFHFTTDSGRLLVQSDNTAVLALLPGSPSAIVTVSTTGTRPGQTTPEVFSTTITIQNYCANINSVHGPTEIQISVTASPNVIPCGGTAKITATARDAAGRIIPNLGWHFTTEYGGLLSGPPNTANATNASVELTLLPGMGRKDDLGLSVTEDGVRSVIVRAWVGSKVGEVKVQQFCLGVVTDSSTAPGRLVLVPENSSLGCAGTTFIGAVVKDSKGQVPVDANAPINFLASSGTVTPNTNVLPKNGSVNVTYKADPGTNGEVRISGAAGATFGSTTIVVNCPFGAAAGGNGTAAAFAGAFGSGTPPGGLIRPPSTGENGLIRPPNTGDAGLARD